MIIDKQRMGWDLIELRKIMDARGNLTPIESGRDIPFNINRVYFIYDIPGGSQRAGHAHISLEQVYIAVSGSFDVQLYDGNKSETITLNRPYIGLYIGTNVWRNIENFSSGAVCLVMASAHFDERDYIRNLASFEQQMRAS